MMKTIADADHDKAEHIMRDVFGIDSRHWPNGLCGQIEMAINEARMEGSIAMRQAMELLATGLTKPPAA